MASIPALALASSFGQSNTEQRLHSLFPLWEQENNLFAFFGMQQNRQFLVTWAPPISGIHYEGMGSTGAESKQKSFLHGFCINKFLEVLTEELCL